MQFHVGVLKTSLRNKIVLMALAIAILASATMGVATYRRSVDFAQELATAKLGGETRLAAARITETLRDMREDVAIIASTAPIDGIIRSVRADGIDPEDGYTAKRWKDRLARVFSAMLEARPSYMKIRYIGLQEDGREIVRVDRTRSGLIRSPQEQLQALQDEPFFKIGESLAPQEWTFSQVTLNREYGRVDDTRTPTLRAIYPIFDEQGKRFGMVIINADYEALLANAIKAAAPDSYTIAINEAGDYLVSDGREGFTKLVFHEDDNYSVIEPLRDGNEDGLLKVGDYFFYSYRTVIDLSRENLVLDVLTRAPKEEILAPARQASFDSLLLGLGLLIITSTAALALARKLTRPLEVMTGQVEKLADSETELDLPVSQPDEIGALARAFQEVTGDLVDSETKIRAIIDNVGDGLVVKDETGVVDMVNPAAEDLFGYPHGSMTGKSIGDLVSGGLKKRAGRGTVEVEANRRDGSRFDAELTVSTVKVKDRDLYCGIIRDISERKKVARMKDEFVSTVNHELRTPLTSIAGSLSLLQAKAAGKLDEKSTRLIELAQSGAERLGRLVNDILDVEKIEAGKLDYRMEPVEIVDLIQEVIAQQEPLALRHGIVFDFETDVPRAIVNVDSDRFEQALVNLLSNAAKYSNAGDAVDIKIGQCGKPGEICVSVRDHGPGIPKAFENDVFDRFTQADLSGSQKRGSSGLGLYITKTLVEAFGGTIEFETDEGIGTTFRIRLPLLEAPVIEERKSA